MTNFRIPVAIRWVDLDAQGHVNNAAVVDYLQEARVSFLLGGPNAHLLGNGVIVVGHSVEYLAPITYSEDPLDVNLRLGEVGASRFALGYTIHQAGKRVARARTGLCLFDFETQRPTRLAPGERAAFAADAEDLERFRSLGSWQVGEQAHEHDFVVRWSDLDAYGHANNAVFFEYVAEARVAMYAAVLPDALRTGLRQGSEHAWLVARQDISYLEQVHHRVEPYRVRTAVARLGRTSLTLAAQVEDPLTGGVGARTLTVLAHADPTGRPSPLPAEFRDAVARWPAVRQGRRSS